MSKQWYASLSFIIRNSLFVIRHLLRHSTQYNLHQFTYPDRKANGKRAFFANYSVRRDLTGLRTAAFTAWKLTVTRVMSSAAPPAPAKIHQGSVVRYA